MFKVFIATTVFQRLQDQLVFRILRGLSPQRVSRLSSVRSLLAAVSRAPCELVKTSTDLHEVCDLTKVPDGAKGVCARAPNLRCHLKDHTIWLKRYGHFGKVPSSAVLMLKELGVRDFGDLFRSALNMSSPQEGAAFLENALMRVWRVSRKIAAMFLSAACNPDLTSIRAPWSDGIDWSRFVVIDSNTDLFLKSIGYQGAGTYDARLNFLSEVAHRVDLRAMSPRLTAYNPRLVQQAMYMFMSASNRRASRADCSFQDVCSTCPRELSLRCPLRVTLNDNQPG